MIRHIVALDAKRGIAKDNAMPPWKIPGDEAYFTRQTLSSGGVVLMGKKTFIEALKEHPLKGRTNYVVTRGSASIPNVNVVSDLIRFIRAWPSDETLWIIGGAEIFAQTLEYADELYVTEIDGDFDCDRFYPSYQDTFELLSESEPQLEDELTYIFRIYRPKVS